MSARVLQAMGAAGKLCVGKITFTFVSSAYSIKADVHVQAPLYARLVLCAQYGIRPTGLPREALHKSKFVIASAAKQSTRAYKSSTYGSPRRVAPRDDGFMQTLLKPL